MRVQTEKTMMVAAFILMLLAIYNKDYSETAAWFVCLVWVVIAWSRK